MLFDDKDIYIYVSPAVFGWMLSNDFLNYEDCVNRTIGWLEFFYKTGSYLNNMKEDQEVNIVFYDKVVSLWRSWEFLNEGQIAFPNENYNWTYTLCIYNSGRVDIQEYGNIEALDAIEEYQHWKGLYLV